MHVLMHVCLYTHTHAHSHTCRQSSRRAARHQKQNNRLGVVFVSGLGLGPVLVWVFEQYFLQQPTTTGVEFFSGDRKLLLFRSLPDVVTGANYTLTLLTRIFNMGYLDEAQKCYVNWDGMSARAPHLARHQLPSPHLANDTSRRHS